MEKLLNKLKNVEDEIVNIWINKVINCKEIHKVVTYSNNEMENNNINEINYNILIEYTFNKDLISNYLTLKPYYTRYDIDIINLILKSIQIQTAICILKYKYYNNILTDIVDQTLFINNNTVRTGYNYDLNLCYKDETNTELIKIFDIINTYYLLNINQEIKKYLF